MKMDADYYANVTLVYVWDTLNLLRNGINQACAGQESWQIVLYTLIVTIISQVTYDFLFTGDGPFKKVKKSFFMHVKKIPYVKRQIEAEVDQTARSIKEDFAADLKPGMTFIERLPAVGLSQDEIFRAASEYQSMGRCKLYEGMASGTLYNGDRALTSLNAKIYEMFTWTNPLHADLFPDVRKMEAEVVRMCITMFNGDSECCGTMTSGGTESIMLACKAYRDRAISRGVKRPEMLIPRSAHAAFDKACLSFNIQARYVPPDPVTMAVDVKKMASMISRNTCMLVGSTPDFAMGALDCIEEIGKLGQKYNIPVHVDACLGGFLLPFMDKAGFPLPPFDFRVPGVCSISCDTHKYGFAPKGSSVILYKSKELRRFQYYVVTDWPGGIYATPSLGGSRPGAIIASCWATLMNFGEEGYVQSTKKIIETARYIRERLKHVPGVFVYGDPLVSVLTIGSLDFDIFRLYAAMKAKGWSLNALQFPSSFHLCCTLVTTKPGVADRFLSDITECTALIMANPQAKASGMAAVYGMSQGIPDRSLVGELVMEFLDAVYDTSLKAKTDNGYSIQANGAVNY